MTPEHTQPPVARCSTCRGCPACHGTVEVQIVYIDERTAVPGRWECSRGCDLSAAAPTDCATRQRPPVRYA